MSAKVVGSIRKTPQKSVGKLYRSSASKSRQSLVSSTKFNGLPNQNVDRYSSSRKRSDSVGKIYSSKQKQTEQLLQTGGRLGKGLSTLINYNEMEHKLSDYLSSTIRTQCRQKYNYLSECYREPSRSANQCYKESMPEVDCKSRKNMVAMSQLHQTNYVNNRVAAFSKKLESQVRNERNSHACKKYQTRQNKENVHKSKNNHEKRDLPCQPSQKHHQSIPKREVLGSMFTSNHQEDKSELSNKLMKIISNYETKNKELNNQLQQLKKSGQGQKFQSQKSEVLPAQQQKQKKEDDKAKAEEISEQDVYSQTFLNSVLTQLVDYNLKGICLAKQCDGKLDQLWKSIHSQIILDQKVRIIKCFFTDVSISHVANNINSIRLKKVEVKNLKTNTEEYDPFLVEKFTELFQTKNPNLNTKKVIQWIADSFIKLHEEAQHHWLKFLSQQKVECGIKAMLMDKDISGLRHGEGMKKELNLRVFTRELSTLFKANLRNRNVYHIFSKLKGMPYIGRFIELLQERTGKGQEIKKASSK